MDREGFRNRLKQYKLAREENPGLKYWEWKNIPKYDEGTDGVRDNTYVAPIEKELVFISATGATKLKLDIRNKITRNGQIKSGAVDIVSPEFDLLTSIRSLPKLAFKSFDFKNKVNIGDKWNKWGSESLVQSVDDYYFKIPQKGFKGLNNDFAKEVRKKLRFNELPENTRVPYTYEGYIVDGKGHYFPVVKQKAVRQHTDESINNLLFVDILNEFKKAGYSANTKYAGAQNKWYNVQDYSPNQNIGELNDKGVLFDAILGESYAPQFIKTFKENYEFIKDRPFITGLNTVSENTENFADGGEVTGPPTYEQWDAEMNQYNPTILDNTSMYWSLGAAKKDLHKQAMSLPGYAPMWHKYVRSLPKADPDIEKFIDDLWLNENPDNVGYRNGKYYPHNSPEGGSKTIGPGFKLGSGSHRITEAQAKKGLTKWQLNKEAERIGLDHLDAVNSFINYGQNTNPADTVSPLIKLGLMDLRHQVGPMNTWHSLRDAVLTGDLDKIRKESTVTWNDDGEIKVDKRRKKIRDEKYFHYADGGEVESDLFIQWLQNPVDSTTYRYATENPELFYNKLLKGYPIEQPLQNVMDTKDLVLGITGTKLVPWFGKLFPRYGTIFGAAMFGNDNNENLIVRKPLRKGDPTVKPISTNNIAEDTRDFYREYVTPLSDHLTDQLKLEFLNNDKNFMYNIYPESRFDEGVLGFRNKYTGEIALNEKILDDPITFSRTMAHEIGHSNLYGDDRPKWQKVRINRNSPRTIEEKKTRMGSNSEAYASHEALKQDIVNDFKSTYGRKPTLKEYQDYVDAMPSEKLREFRIRDSYGRMYENNEAKKLAQKNLSVYDYSKWVNTNKRNTLKYVPATVPLIMSEKDKETT